jgi:hypothetical protein
MYWILLGNKLVEKPVGSDLRQDTLPHCIIEHHPG